VDQMIKHLGQPRRLILEWEPPIEASDRKRWSIGEVIGDGVPSSFRYFTGIEFENNNDGRTIDAARQAGYWGFPAFGPHKDDLAKPIETGVAETLARRLAARSRSDFNDYLKHHLLQPSEMLTDMALLGATGARLPGDGFAVTDPLDNITSARDMVIELVGFRHYLDKSLALPRGAVLQLQPEPNSEHDPDAIKVIYGTETVGYINRLQAKGLGRLIQTHDVSAYVHRFNGTPTRPRAYAFVQVREAVGQVAA